MKLRSSKAQKGSTTRQNFVKGRAAEILETGRRGEALYSREQREAALEAYDRLGDVRAAVRELGYPSDTALAGWVRRRGEAPRPRKPAVRL